MAWGTPQIRLTHPCPRLEAARTIYPSFSNVSVRTESTTGSETKSGIVVFSKDWSTIVIPSPRSIPGNQISYVHRRLVKPGTSPILRSAVNRPQLLRHLRVSGARPACRRQYTPSQSGLSEFRSHRNRERDHN